MLAGPLGFEPRQSAPKALDLPLVDGPIAHRLSICGSRDPSLRSGFRQRAQTPANRLNLPLVDGPV
jgi:hypothetical protein